MPAPKDYIKIQYPRKCNHCDYISNNPQMWHYHNKTHDPIPEGQLCDQGCGQPALFRNTNGKYSCRVTTYQCDSYIKKHSTKVKQQWSSPEAVARKEQTKKSLIERLHNPESVNKSKETKRKKSGLLTPEDAKNFRHYARAIRQRAQLWATDNGYKLGHQTYHVDHKLSILDAWKLNLPAEIVNHPANLQVIEAKRNTSKGSKSSITVEQLYEMIRGDA